MLASRLPVSVQPPACSRCFRTNAEGRILLRRDWPAVFSALLPLDEIAIQSRHTYARLVHLGRPPEVVWDETGLLGRDKTGALQFYPRHWGSAHGRLAACHCCDSPGYIEILNARGGEILQLCPTAATSPAGWAACLEPLADTRPEPGITGWLAGFPLLPVGLQPLHENADVLPALLAALGREQAAVRFLLRTPEVAHLREFVPTRVISHGPLLTATDFRITLQLALPPVQGLFAAPDRSLHLAGPGGTLLLSLASAAGHAAPWSAALLAAFPSLRPFLSTP